MFCWAHNESLFLGAFFLPRVEWVLWVLLGKETSGRLPTPLAFLRQCLYTVEESSLRPWWSSGLQQLSPKLVLFLKVGKPDIFLSPQQALISHVSLGDLRMIRKERLIKSFTWNILRNSQQVYFSISFVALFLVCVGGRCVSFTVSLKSH